MFKVSDLVTSSSRGYIRSLIKEEFIDGTFHFFPDVGVKIYNVVVLQKIYAPVWNEDPQGEDDSWIDTNICEVLTPDLVIRYYREEDLERYV